MQIFFLTTLQLLIIFWQIEKFQILKIFVTFYLYFSDGKNVFGVFFNKNCQVIKTDKTEQHSIYSNEGEHI